MALDGPHHPVAKQGDGAFTTRFARWRHNQLLITLAVLLILLVVLALVSGAVLYFNYHPYKRRPQIADKPCERMMCTHGAKCLVDLKTQQAYCSCQETCKNVFAPVCGTDDVTYSNECQLRMASCTQQRKIQVRHQGTCDIKNPCEVKSCHFGSECRPDYDNQKAECVCPERCSTYGDSHGSRWVCGSDGREYHNLCELKMKGCREMRDLSVKFHGRCDPCIGVECPQSQVCQLDDNRNAVCRCNSICSPDFRPVCGSDGKTYTNECVLRVEACKSRKELRVIYNGECTPVTNPCEQLHCTLGKECHIDIHGIASCQCPPDCEPVMRPVCGTDGRSYPNDCELRRQACLQRKPVQAAYRGECSETGPCHKYHCTFGAMCVVKSGRPDCECPTCSEEFEPVCGDDGISYSNECKLKREACEQKREIKVVYNRLCNGCENKKCDFYAVCETDSRGEILCACPETCVQVESPVCGTDAVTYNSECELRVAACKLQQHISVASKGPCDLCLNVHCKYGATCENGRCVCPTDCPESYEPICANDGSTYQNECEMRRESCQQDQELNAMFYGECEDVGGSGLADLGSGAKGCTDKFCKYGGVCDYDSDGLPHCLCSYQCTSVMAPVCGSDGRIYDNDCKLKEEGCKQQKELNSVAFNICEGTESKEQVCDGESPLVDPVTGKEYSCGNGPNSKPCPPNSYCHKGPGFNKCCREVAMIKSCADTTFGCCDDHKTAAQGPNQAGCPNVCNCNRLGSYTQTCDPESKQCPCKPGVGGLQCDRCEPGFWGLHKISEGNEGCVPCSCNLSGSVRDDCEQMTGRCVCRHGIQGMKCDICPKGTVLGQDGCMDASIARALAGSCDQLKCFHGATCKEKGNQVQCVCDFKCTPDDNRNPVCGSDGNTYGSECQLQMFSCRYQKPITVKAPGPCKTATGVTPTTGPVRRSTIRKVPGLAETKSPRDVTLGLPENLFLSSKPTVTTPLAVEFPIEIPSFFGQSFLELPKLDAYTRLSLEMEFRTFTNDGVLLYNGQTSTGAGDFVSLTIKEGFVEFRYNLGSGLVTLRSLQKLQPGKYHRLIAKRYLRDGMLSLDGEEDVSGRSLGNLKSLNLGENLYIGYFPKEHKGIFNNIGVMSGFVGCIRRLKIGRKDVNLTYPGSAEILRAVAIRECADSPCSSMPCQNGASCTTSGIHGYKCHCTSKFTGKQCESPLDPCSSNPCSFGATCAVLPQGGFSCRCPPGRIGRLCEELHKEMEKPFVPDFNSHAYLELPKLANVGQAFTIIIWFMTRSQNGMLLYNGQLTTGRGDFVAINLVDGLVQLKFNLGSGIANITDEEEDIVDISNPKPVVLNRWHSLKVSRQRRRGSIQLDDGPVTFGESKGLLDILNLKLPLYVGGFPPSFRFHHKAGITRGLDGAIQRIVMNGEVWDNLLLRATKSRGVKAYQGPPCTEDSCLNGGLCVPHLNDVTCRCPLKFMGRRCEKFMAKKDIKKPVQFNGTTFLSFPNKIGKRSTSQRDNHFEIKFSTTHRNGVLLWMNKGVTSRGDYLCLVVSRGHLELSYNLGKQKELLIIKSKVRVDDGRWHSVVVKRNKRLGVLKVDNAAPVNSTSSPGATELNTSGILWIGGTPSLPSGLPPTYYHGFKGCIDSVVTDGLPLHLVLRETGEVQFCGAS